MKNYQSISNIFSSMLLFAMVMVLSGCAVSKVIKPADLNIGKVVPTKIPLKVGLYSKNFQGVSCSASSRLRGTHIENVGARMSSWAEIVIKQIFKEVNPVDSLESKKIEQDIKAIVIPDIIIVWCAAWKSEALIISKWTVVSPDGKILYMNTFRSDIRTVSFIPDQIAMMEKSMTLAVKDQYQQLLSDILSYNWWENIK